MCAEGQAQHDAVYWVLNMEHVVGATLWLLCSQHRYQAWLAGRLGGYSTAATVYVVFYITIPAAYCE